MIQKYKNISIGKVKDSSDNPKMPTHSITVADSDYQNKRIVGKLWTKESTYGKFLSGSLSQTQQKDDKLYEGYVIVNEVELDKLISALEMKKNSPLGDGYPVEGGDIPEPSEIPF